MISANAFDPPVVLPVYEVNIPDTLKNIKQWVGWKVGQQKPNDKYAKIPVDLRGKACNAHQSLNQMSFKDALQLYKRGFSDGVGFVLNGRPILVDGENLYLVGIDMDHCVEYDQSGNPVFSDQVEDVRNLLKQTYMEISPSGTGVRMFAWSEKSFKSGNSHGREMYFDKRFLTITGNGGGPIKEATAAIGQIHADWFPNHSVAGTLATRPTTIKVRNLKQPDKDPAVLAEALSYISADCDYDTWRNIVWAIIASGLEDSEEIARRWSQSATDRYTDEGFDRVVSSFDPERGITVGTLFYYARLTGWTSGVGPVMGADEGDILNGKLFANEFRHRYCFIHETDEFLKFSDQTGWIHSKPREAEVCAKSIVAQLLADAAESFKRDPNSGETKRKMQHAKHSSMQPRIQAMISLAKSEPGMTVRLAEFDAIPNYLGVKNGVLDLTTSKLLEPSPEILVSMRANAAFNRDARCPKWMDFLDTVQPDKAVQRIFQQLVGVFMTGDASLQKLIIFFGLGANGKSTFIELISWLLGDYSLRIQTEMLMHHQRSPQGPSPDIVALKGRRLAYCNELEEGRRLDEARVKELTGGDTLTGRLPYAKHNVTFAPTHNLVMVGNHKPEIHDMSHGMWRRVLLIPFDVQIPTAQQDAQLGEKLKNEASGILNWALAGYRDFLRYGLRIPKSITAATDNYRDEEDLLGEWIEEDCNVVIGGKVRIDDCYRSYKFWAESRGHRPLAQSRLTKRLKERGYDRDAGKRHYLGIELKTSMRGD